MRILTTAAILAATALATPASASLGVFDTWIGTYGLSTDGGGSIGQRYTVSADVPLGATVVAAYLYQSNYSFSSDFGPFGVSLDGNAVGFGAPKINGTDCCGLNSSRADVTALVKAKVDGGPGGIYDFSVLEDNPQTDGTALVVVYSLASLGISTIAILDGSSNVNGDSFSANFANGLDPAAAGFQADLRLGIGFSCCGQQSSVAVNGTTITEFAGNNDDATEALSNGNLITVGGFNDAYSPFLPGYDDDHERYDLSPWITLGDTTISVNTFNPSNDDNIFLATFWVTGEGVIVTPGVPEPASWAMLIAGFGLVGFAARRRRPHHTSA